LIQAAKVLLTRPQNWPRFSFGTWLKAASERLHRNKLAVALANKLARIAWSSPTEFAIEDPAWNGSINAP
jgi:transposase